ncbi:MAG: DNA polymerase-3 subunit delta' [Limisphaerales bacterium]
MRISELIAHVDLTRDLCQSVVKGKLPHALLLLGPKGNGALAVALAFAQYVNCEDKQKDDSCGACPSCLKAAQFIHPDIHYSYPIITVLTGSKAAKKLKSTDYVATWREALNQNRYLSYQDWISHMQDAIGGSNKQGNIPRDECMDIMHKLSLKTFESKHKIIIMWLPEYLGNEGNRLLKLIEEPPEGTLFLMVAEDPDRILGTVLSRTQVVRIPRMRTESIAAGLLQNFETDEESADLIAAQSDGNYCQAYELMSNGSNMEAGNFNKWFTMTARWQVLSLVRWYDEFAKIGRESQKNFFGYAMHFTRTCMMHHLGIEESANAYSAKASKGLSAEGWQAFAEKIQEAQYHIERNANPKIVMMELSIAVSKMIQQNQINKSTASPSA